MPRYCIHSLKSCCWYCLRPSPGRTTSSRRHCGEHLAFLRRFYSYESGIPSHDTLCDVFAALDPELFKACFQAWVSSLVDADADIIAH
jgi:hypothetical protein